MTFMSPRVFHTLLLVILIPFVWITLYTNSLNIIHRGFESSANQIRQTKKIVSNRPLPAPVNWNGSEIKEILDETHEEPHPEESLQGHNTDPDSTPSGDSASKISETEILSEIAILNRFRERRARVREVCDRNKDLEHNVQNIRFRSIFYSQKYNLMVCAPPKVGSSTWIMFMLLMRGVQSIPKQLHGNMSLVRAKNVLGKEETRHRQSSATTFIIVRHPLERLNSAFRSKFANGGPLSKNIRPLFHRVYWKPALKMLNKDPNVVQYITFTEFLQFVIAHSHNGHWRPIHAMCSPCAIDYEYFVRLETFSEDMKYLSRALPNPVLHLHVQKNKQSNTTDASQHGTGQTDHTHLRSDTLLYYSQVPAKLLATILHMYRLDLDLFNYQVPEKLMRRAGLTQPFKEQ